MERLNPLLDFPPPLPWATAERTRRMLPFPVCSSLRVHHHTPRAQKSRQVYRSVSILIVRHSLSFVHQALYRSSLAAVLVVQSPSPRRSYSTHTMKHIEQAASQTSGLRSCRSRSHTSRTSICRTLTNSAPSRSSLVASMVGKQTKMR